jgi:hypothetical protein
MYIASGVTWEKSLVRCGMTGAGFCSPEGSRNGTDDQELTLEFKPINTLLIKGGGL